VGLSLTSLASGSEGKSLWQFKAGGPPVCMGGGPGQPQTCTGGSGTALYSMSWDTNYAYWFTTPPNEILTILDIKTGQQVHGWSLAKGADVRKWDTATNAYVLMSGIDINATADWAYNPALMMHVVPDWHSNIAANGYMWFLTVTNNDKRWAPSHSGPPNSLGRINIATGKPEYLQLPVEVVRSSGASEQRIYGKAETTTCTDAKGDDLPADARSYTDGWEIPAFWPTPILIGTKLYFSTTLGLTYVIDSTAQVLDETAILGIGDLGPMGQTWSLAGPSFAGGVMYHHDSKEVVAIKQ
jgi:hypothetical protein